MQSESSNTDATIPANVNTLQQFYNLMAQTRLIRRRMVHSYLDRGAVASEDVDSLKRALDVLSSVSGSPAHATVQLDQIKTIALDLGYEIGELEKDILFFSRGEEQFRLHLNGIHNAFEEQVDEGVKKLKGIEFRSLVSDRDGTVNNYCGRYLSSIQSAYNAVYLTRFAAECVANAVILTSAPLDRGGLVDISVAPEDKFIYAGSKGREYLYKGQRRGSLPIPQDQQGKLRELNERLEMLLANPDYALFALIGSGFQ
ncbi:MAG: trehalose 6-phosphate synthase, partial [Chitinivibrionales bacterium]|nr:trehalose 6-phosphate synthase [Chitinivibrionales bacterium]MBD3358399.1 trehalose 6-phosphate synthase [Chitinivibrionales bacterium]